MNIFTVKCRSNCDTLTAHKTHRIPVSPESHQPRPQVCLQAPGRSGWGCWGGHRHLLFQCHPSSPSRLRSSCSLGSLNLDRAVCPLALGQVSSHLPDTFLGCLAGGCQCSGTETGSVSRGLRERGELPQRTHHLPNREPTTSHSCIVSTC